MAGTINTTNYNFKKYAPDDTVSMLQTFNGNMDAIDKAIKDRADIETEQGASIAKVEAGLASTNNGLNSANQAISAVQVQVTTNTRNIQNANTEIDTLDARVQALEDGGSSIEPLQTTLPVQPTRSYTGIYKQGKHIFGTGIFEYATLTSSSVIAISSADNYSIPTSTQYLKLLAINNNIFGLNPNIAHAIGIAMVSWKDGGQSYTAPSILLAVFDGTTTFIASLGYPNWTEVGATITIDTTI